MKIESQIFDFHGNYLIIAFSYVQQLSVTLPNCRPKGLHAERLKRTFDDMRKFTGRQLLDYSAKHFPKCFAQEFQAHAGKDRERRFWQPTQHPVGIVSEAFWKQKLDYLHQNPCRKGLVVFPEDWRFSSARYWLRREENEVQLSDVGWG